MRFDMGKAIRVGLAIKNINRGEFAETLGVSAPYISRLCNGKVSASLSKCDEFAGYFGVKLSRFIEWGE